MATTRVSCVSCDNQILPDTAVRNSGLCGVCERKRKKPVATAATEAAITPHLNLEPWLKTRFRIFNDLIAGDLRRHAGMLTDDKIDFCGYAILAEDYTTISDDDPPSIMVAYNRESDFTEANLGSVYDRFSPDECENYFYSGFGKTNLALRALYAEFLEQFFQDPCNEVCEKNRGTFLTLFIARILKA